MIQSGAPLSCAMSAICLSQRYELAVFSQAVLDLSSFPWSELRTKILSVPGWTMEGRAKERGKTRLSTTLGGY